MKFAIQLTPDSQKIIDGLEKSGKFDIRPTMRVIGVGYRKEVKAIFEKQQPRGEGEKWKPLSDRYKAWKSSHFPGTPILVRTGELKRSMTQEGAPGNITLISKTGAVFGTSISYGIYHDSDQPRDSGLPRRNFSDPSDRRMMIWIGQIEAAARHNFEQNGISFSGTIAEVGE